MSNVVRGARAQDALALVLPPPRILPSLLSLFKRTPRRRSASTHDLRILLLCLSLRLPPPLLCSADRPNPTARQAKRGCEAVAEGSLSQAKRSKGLLAPHPPRGRGERSRSYQICCGAHGARGFGAGLFVQMKSLGSRGGTDGECGIPCGRGSRPRRRAACA